MNSVPKSTVWPTRIEHPDPAMNSNAAYFMNVAITAAANVYSTTPNPRVGCVIVKHGQIVGTGLHEKPGHPHAEVNALQMAGEAARGAIAYVSLEPCCHHAKPHPAQRH